MVITSDWLFLHDACNSEVKKFERHFPDGVRATAEDLDKAHELGFSVDWLVSIRIARPNSLPSSPRTATVP